ncbi:uncharacterized protein Pyn_38490 [Prunus yedoensis var. nudiflora]|uniref:Uncharacterized protein n=1 Tax=Prunus yedoensis var. nudiflora TaxID=2094558 RepID=A0A314ZEX2_PRUYE|nr:uncharacterized protein Pyn_38490 [Prunus yedoensis var. nudiflora]
MVTREVSAHENIELELIDDINSAIPCVSNSTDEVDYADLDGDTQDLEDIYVIDDISPTSTNGQKRRNRASNSSDILPIKKRAVIKDVIANSIARMALLFEVRTDTKNLDPAEMLKALPN